MTTIKLIDKGSKIIARLNGEEIGSCLYSGNLGASAARRTVIEQIKAKHDDFDLVSSGRGETLTTHFRGGVAVSETWS